MKRLYQNNRKYFKFNSLRDTIGVCNGTDLVHLEGKLSRSKYKNEILKETESLAVL